MLTEEQFIDFINVTENYDNEVTRWSDFGIDIFELPICELTWNLVECFIESHFTEDGQDWINWYLFERVSVISGEVLPCYDEDGNKFYVNNAEDLWKLVEQHQISYVDEEACDTRSDIS